jgi:hypothetical protein
MNSSFRREAEENCALLGYYVASIGISSPTFRNNVCSVFNGQESRKKRKGVTLVVGGERGHVGGDKFSVAWSQPMGLMQVGGGKGKCSRQCYFATKSSRKERLLLRAGQRQRKI